MLWSAYKVQAQQQPVLTVTCYITLGCCTYIAQRGTPGKNDDCIITYGVVHSVRVKGIHSLPYINA